MQSPKAMVFIIVKMLWYIFFNTIFAIDKQSELAMSMSDCVFSVSIVQSSFMPIVRSAYQCSLVQRSRDPGALVTYCIGMNRRCNL